jgi:threonyl-tRNA synthetase
MLHRAIFGSLERFIGIITEHYGGAFPTWLAPVQIRLIPVSREHHLDYVKKIKDLLFNEGLRVEIDNREEKLGYKIRDAQTQKIPYQLVVGEKEVSENLLTYRKYGGVATTMVAVEDFVKMIKAEIANLGK